MYNERRAAAAQGLLPARTAPQTWASAAASMHTAVQSPQSADVEAKG